MELLINAGMKLNSISATTCSMFLSIKWIVLISNADWSMLNSSLAQMHEIVTCMAHFPKFSLCQGFLNGGLRVDEKLKLIKGPDILTGEGLFHCKC